MTKYKCWKCGKTMPQQYDNISCSKPGCIGTFTLRIWNNKELNDLKACLFNLENLVDMGRNDENDHELDSICHDLEKIIEKYAI